MYYVVRLFHCRLFGIGNLSSTALEGFKSSHRCNVYCVALDLPGECTVTKLVGLFKNV